MGFVEITIISTLYTYKNTVRELTGSDWPLDSDDASAKRISIRVIREGHLRIEFPAKRIDLNTGAYQVDPFTA